MVIKNLENKIKLVGPDTVQPLSCRLCGYLPRQHLDSQRNGQ